jgi:hypothetical protein
MDEAERLRALLAERRYDAITKGVATELLSSEVFEPTDLETFDQLCAAIVRARIEAHRIYAAKLRGRYNEVAPRDPLFAAIRLAIGLEESRFSASWGPRLNSGNLRQTQAVTPKPTAKAKALDWLWLYPTAS